LQLQTTVSFEKKHTEFELQAYNKLFNASHVSLVVEKHNFIEILIYPAFSGWITQKCSFPHQCYITQSALA